MLVHTTVYTICNGAGRNPSYFAVNRQLTTARCPGVQLQKREDRRDIKDEEKECNAFEKGCTLFSDAESDARRLWRLCKEQRFRVAGLFRGEQLPGRTVGCVENGGEGSTELPSSNRKIVYTGNISLQTLEYDKSAQSIHDKINKYGGFVENEDTFNEDPYWYYKNRTGAAANRTKRNLNITARIPAEKFNAFMKDLEEDGQVINTSVNARNISVQYATHDASRKALEIEQGRLLEMMEKAETVEEMIAVEERLTEVERELNDEKTQLSAMDRDVGFSTIYISLQEVFEYSETVVEVSYGEQLKRAFGRACEGFVTFWKDLILFIVETFPFLIMLGVIITVIVKLIRRGRRRRLEKRVRMEEQRRAAMQAGAGLTADSGLTGDAGSKAGREPEAGGGLKAGREPEADGGPAADGSSKADVKRT